MKLIKKNIGKTSNIQLIKSVVIFIIYRESKINMLNVSKLSVYVYHSSYAQKIFIYLEKLTKSLDITI